MKSVETINHQILLQNFQNLLDLIDKVCTPEYASGLKNMLNKLAVNHQDGDKLCPGFICAPASYSAHHSEPGGLVTHCLQMWELSEVLRTNVPAFQVLNAQTLLAGIIFHDLHKASYNYIFVSDAEFEKNPNQHFKYHDGMITKILQKSQRSYQIIIENGILLTLEQANALFGSEGGWAESPPKATSVLSKFLYLLDELSANVFDRIIKGRMFDYKMSIGCPTFNTIVVDTNPVQPSAEHIPVQVQPTDVPTDPAVQTSLNVTVLTKEDGTIDLLFYLKKPVEAEFTSNLASQIKEKLGSNPPDGLYTVVLNNNTEIEKIVHGTTIVWPAAVFVEHVSV